MALRVFCDGGARGNPGPAAIGVVVEDGEGTVLRQFGKTIGPTTNNVAEYTAVVEALSWIRKSRANQKSDRIDFYLDSELVVSQLNGLYKVKNERLRMLLLKIRERESVLGGNIFYHHIPRAKNAQADKMVNQALDDALRRVV